MPRPLLKGPSICIRLPLELYDPLEKAAGSQSPAAWIAALVEVNLRARDTAIRFGRNSIEAALKRGDEHYVSIMPPQPSRAPDPEALLYEAGRRAAAELARAQEDALLAKMRSEDA